MEQEDGKVRSWVATCPRVGGASIVFPRPWLGPKSDRLGTGAGSLPLPGESRAAESAHEKHRVQENKIRRTYGADITQTSIKKH